MGHKDTRSAEEKAAWKAGEFTDDEAAASGLTREQANQARAQQERDLGNPLAPPPSTD